MLFIALARWFFINICWRYKHVENGAFESKYYIDLIEAALTKVTIIAGKLDW